MDSDGILDVLDSMLANNDDIDAGLAKLRSEATPAEILAVEDEGWDALLIVLDTYCRRRTFGDQKRILDPRPLQFLLEIGADVDREYSEDMISSVYSSTRIFGPRRAMSAIGLLEFFADDVKHGEASSRAAQGDVFVG